MILRHEHRDAVYGLAYSPDGRLLATGGADGTVITWQLPDVRPALWLGPHDAEVWRVQFLREQPCLVSGTFGGELFLWDLAAGTTRPRQREQTGNGQVRTLVPDPLSDRLFAGSWSSISGGTSAWWRLEQRLTGTRIAIRGL